MCSSDLAVSFSIRHADAPPTILAAGLGGGVAPVEGRAAGGGTAVQASGTAGTPGSGDDETGKGSSAGTPATDDHSDTAWRLRHQRRGVLREVELPSEFLDDLGEPGGAETVAVLFGRAMTSPARAATSFFADAPLSGQVNFLTTNLFDGPDQLTSAAPARGIAYVKLGAPVGDHADWTVRGALTEGDLAAWIVAGDYKTRGDARRARCPAGDGRHPTSIGQSGPHARVTVVA